MPYVLSGSPRVREFHVPGRVHILAWTEPNSAAGQPFDNHLWRWRDRRFRGLAADVVYSPGINCLDADAISVHIVFSRFRDCVKDELHLTRNPLVSWPQLIHRRLYYRLIEALEGHIYPRKDLSLAVVSHKVGADLGHYYGRTSGISVIYGGLDPERFSPLRRAELRCPARKAFGLSETDFALLLIGNDWKNKGLLCLLQTQANGRRGLRPGNDWVYLGGGPIPDFRHSPNIATADRSKEEKT